MNRRLRLKLIVVLAVIVATSLFAWYPPLADRLGLQEPGFLLDKRLALGLDLRGGVQFVLRVNVEEAHQTDPIVSRDEIVEQARQAVDRRINELGVLEPLLAVQGSNRDEILVQLPGFTDVSRARDVIGQTARLEWLLVDAGPAERREDLLANGSMPSGTQILEVARPRTNNPDDAPAQYYRVQFDGGVGGREIRNARSIHDENGLPAVAFTLTRAGGQRFAELTAAHVGRRLAIVLDGRIQSVPVIESAITGGEGTIQGAFTTREALDLALMLRSGALPVSLTYLGGQYVGPTLGLQSARAGLAACLAGLGLVATFMLAYYRRAGINAIWSMLANVLVLLGAMASLGAALSLPGIAGLILTIGMGVDSNVLIFERIKEELRSGRTTRQAVRLGFDRVFYTILDTHVASLVAAAFLFQFGTGPVRGFATTLTLGLLTNVFTAVVVSRTLFEWTLSRTGQPGFSTRVGRRRTIDVMSWRRYAFACSTAIVAGGLALLLARGGVPLGLEFTGGTSVLAKFAAPVVEDDVRRAIAGEETVQRYGPSADHTLLIRVPQSTDAAGAADLEYGVSTIATALRGASLPAFEITGSDMVGPAIGMDLQRKGILATVASLAGISGYIALRFRPSFAAGAIVATLHDIAVTVTMLGLAGYDLTLQTLAAVLTIAGYSVNDTIVIFDRVRENVRAATRMSMPDAINLAVNQTLGRTVITAGTTFLSVLALFFFGGDALQGFAFAMLVGIATGTYSTVFIAAPIAARIAGTTRPGHARTAGTL